MNQKIPELSIIIPAYNEEKFISKCLDCVLKQKTNIPYEVIVVNNNSSDRTGEIAIGKGVKVVDEKKQGVTVAKNTGAKVARGKVLVFVDADCLAPSSYIGRIIKNFSTHPEADVVGGPYIYYDGGVFIRWITERLNYYYWYFRLIKLFFGVEACSGGNMAIKKNVFDKIGGFNEKLEELTDIVPPDDLEICIRLKKSDFKLYYDKNNKVLSSFRRAKRSPIKDSLKRACLSLRLLISG